LATSEWKVAASKLKYMSAKTTLLQGQIL